MEYVIALSISIIVIIFLEEMDYAADDPLLRTC